MFFRILGKDLKRKKTMNVILLLFVILAAMFVASSVNNIVTVTNGLDYYLKTAKFDCDYVVIATDRKGETPVPDVLEALPAVKEIECERGLLGDASNLCRDGKNAADFSGSAFFLPIENTKLNYFDKDDHKITSVKEGEIYVTAYLISKYGLKEGGQYELRFGDVTLLVRIAGSFKDAPFGSAFMGVPRFLMCMADIEKLDQDTILSVSYLKTDSINAVQDALGDAKGVFFQGDAKLIRTTYILDMIIAAILLVLSVGLILISFMMLRFTIGFTLTEEFREIGVMKAIGLKNSRIRLIYITKYLGISLIGAVIGFAASVPFCNLLLRSASQTMVLGNDHSVLVGLLCSAAVVAVIMLFCYSCTGKIKKLSPVDAVRSGQTGERFRKKRGLRIGKSRLGKSGFLAVNDVISSPKQFSIITIVLSLSLSMVMILANLTNTLCSDRLIYLFGMTVTDVYFQDKRQESKPDEADDEETEKTVEEWLAEIEQTLAAHGIPAKASLQVQYNYKASFNGKSISLNFQQGHGTDQFGFRVYEGTEPQNASEFSATPKIADELGAKIGDKVLINVGGEEREYLLTGFFSSMNNTGRVACLHPDAPTKLSDASGYLWYQVDFTDHPDKAEMQHRFAEIKEIFNSRKVLNAAECTEEMTNSADAIRAVQYMILVITLILTALIVVLMERSFISKEKSEIALMKAIGIKSRRIILQHTLRFLVAALAASVIAAAISLPLTHLLITPIFGLMGNSQSISYLVRPVELFAVYPAVLLLTTALSACLTALYTKTIRASQTADIE